MIASGTVIVGGSQTVKLSREDYNYAVLASKPSAMTLRFLDKLFTKETLRRSTFYGTKEFSALDPSKIAAIKGKVVKSYLFHPFESKYVNTVLGNTVANELRIGHLNIYIYTKLSDILNFFQNYTNL